jgi:hypothetical protein
MDENRISGTARNIGGKIEEGAVEHSQTDLRLTLTAHGAGERLCRRLPRK